ncbi:MULTISPECIES: PD-(D/E)XK nuclease family protein [unclassified Pseudofrankia]|uniref:RecB family exonuclease n=1 Tax=unclassified Pseudofrankia TaxID=2994372 RepID=UPI0008DA9370|nr:MULTISPECIES: PD-(D/E)XK nuclease family protein [unclassified Pseudofrankia]MDT3441209.1 PD-(D/E)XK nuclease family protein [Pseudofrankia sp. BMG5.37]OHV54214.1 recombinase RecB [Pseudofrankia sp. BMG5.36]
MAQLLLDGMPRRLFSCTPTRLASFEDCPRRYRMTYVDRPVPPKGPPWAHTSLGVSVHNALHRWWDEPEPRRTPARAAELLRAGWIRDGWRDDEQSAAARERAAAMCERYAAGLDPAVPPRAVERQVATRTEILALHGRVDRLDERDGELVVVDYKTGRRPPEEGEARTSPALALYAFAAERMLRQRCRWVELHHLPTGRVVVAEHTDESLARHIRRAESVAVDAAAATEKLAAGQPADVAFPPRPGPLCSWCDFRRHCPEGQAAGPELTPWAGAEQFAEAGGENTGGQALD